MAAYAALISLMHIIDDIENHHSPPISLDKQQAQSLTQTVMFLQEFLEGYKSPVADGDEADSLEMRMADAAYAAEDAVKSHIVHKAQLSRSKETKDASGSHIVEKGQLSRSKEAIIRCFRDPKNDSSNHDDEQINLYQDVQKVIEEMDQMKKEAVEIAAEAQLQRKVSSSHAASSTSSSTVKESMMVGFADVLLQLLDKLTGGHRNRPIIPITGMAGIGKTTLAKIVYLKSIIRERFDICAWATISQQYNTREILCELVSQATNKSKEQLIERSEDELGLELYQHLSGRRFLIVMDDCELRDFLKG